MANIVVTGGAGFIGRHLVERLARSHNVLVIDDAGERLRAVPVRNDRLKQYNILDKSGLEGHFRGADTVYHLAAFTSVPRSVEEPLECYRQNLVGTQNVLDAAVRAGVRRVVFTSSAAVYGDATSPNREGYEGLRSSPYALSKWAGEDLLRSYSKLLETVSLRLFNVYGPRQRTDDAYAAVIPLFRERIVTGKPVTIFGDGEQTRDFVHVSDVVRALELAREIPNVSPRDDQNLSGRAFNVASGRPTSIKKLSILMHQIVGREPAIEYKAPRAGDLPRSYADVEQAWTRLDFKTEIGLQDGLESILGRQERQTA